MTTAAQQLADDLAKAEAAIKEHAAAWLDLDRRKRKQRELGGLYSLAALGGLLSLAYYSSGPAIQGFVFGAAVVAAGWWYDTRGDLIAREMDKQYRLTREAEHLRDALRAKMADASTATKPEV